MRNIEASLKWIVGILEERKIPFQIDGGLAAKIYGSNRSLADIDLVVSNKNVELLAPLLRNYIKFGPARYKDDSWDVFLMTVEYMEQTIDLSGSDDAKIFDPHKHKWVPIHTNYDRSEVKEIFGMHLPVVPKEDLVFEKSILSRPVDEEDIRDLS